MSIKIKPAYKKYEIFSWEQEQKDVKKSIIGIIILPVTLWIVFYTIPLLILSFKFNVLTKSIFWSLLPNLISASIGTFFIWIAVQAYGRGFRRYVLPSYLHQKILEWRGEIKKQKKELKRLTAVACILDQKLFKEPFVSTDPIVNHAFDQFKENRVTLGETIQRLRISIDEQKQQLSCFEYVMSTRNLFQRFSAILKPYEYWKDQYEEPEIFPLEGDD